MVIKLGVIKIFRVDHKMLTRDLFAVANLLIQLNGRDHITPSLLQLHWL